MKIDSSFIQQIESSLRIEYHNGAISCLSQYVNEWCVMPCAVISQVSDGQVTCHLDEGRSLELEPGDAICIAPGIRHRFENTWPGINVFRWTHINFFIFSYVDLTTFFVSPFVLKGAAALEVGDISGELSHLRSENSLEIEQMVRRQSLCYRLLELYLSGSTLAQEGRQLLPYLERLSPVLLYINENLMKPLTREELAATLHLSPSHFYALFKEGLGVSPTEYVHSLRLRHAQRLLLNTNLYMSEVGARSGYPDEYHFSRVFKKRFGLSPLQYRKSMVRESPGEP